jgi:hypothetical protein
MNVRTLGHAVFLYAGLVVALSLVRCTTTTGSHPVYHLPPAVNNILTTDQITVLANMGMTINNGTTPPSIVGSYYTDALLLTGSNVPGDNNQIRIKTYANYSYRFSNQTAAGNISVERAIQGGTSVGFGEGAIISGSGNDFSIFTDLTDSIVSDSGYHHIIIFKSARIISGTFSAAGIKGFRYAFICTAKEDDPFDEEIEVDQGRVIWESDSIASSTSTYPFAKMTVGPAKSPDDIRR